MVRLLALSVTTFCLVLPSAAPASLGHKIADSGPRQGGLADAQVRIHSPKRVFVRGTSNPRQALTGTWSVNCIVGNLQTVFHRSAGLRRFENGVVTFEVPIPGHKAFDYCQITPAIDAADSLPGVVRVQMFVRPFKRG
jgi:hypothetical protein